MRKVHHNRLYDTEKAQRIVEHDGKVLYKKRNSEYFLYVVEPPQIVIPLPSELQEFARAAGVEREVYGDAGTYCKTTVTLPRELYNKLNEIAALHHETKSTVVARLIKLAK